MIERLCQALLRYAARGWPAAHAASMLSEWQAEVHAEPGRVRRLRFAGSLALARPHGRTAAGPVIAWHRGLLASAVLLVVAPIGYRYLSRGWTSSFSEDTVVAQSIVGALSLLAAIGLGWVCATWTAGVAHHVPAPLIAVWTFGLQFAAIVACSAVLSAGPVRSLLIDHACWLVVGVASMQLAMRLPVLPAGAVAAVGVLAATWFAEFLHRVVYPYPGVPQSPMVTVAFAMLVGPVLQVTAFSAVYALRLARLRVAVMLARDVTITA
jgi:hypothetical protein